MNASNKNVTSMCFFCEKSENILSKLLLALNSLSESEQAKIGRLKHLYLLISKIFTFETNSNNDSDKLNTKKTTNAKDYNVCQHCQKKITIEVLLVLKKQLYVLKKELIMTLITCILRNNNVNIRIESLKTIILLNFKSSFHEIMESCNLSCFIIRLLDLTTSKKELCLIIEYIRRLVKLYPEAINESYIYALSAHIWNTEINSAFLCLETLLELAYINPLLTCKCQVLPELLKYIIYFYPENDLLVEAIIFITCRALSFYNCRELVKTEDIFSYLVAPFIDHHYIYTIINTHTDISGKENIDQFENFKKKPNDLNNKNYSHYLGSDYGNCGFNTEFDFTKIKKIYAACARAIASVFNNFTGTIIFSSSDLRNILDLLTGFHIYKEDSINEEIKVCILYNLLNIFYKVFKISQSDKTKINKISATSELNDNDINFNPIFSVQEEFINAECKLMTSYQLELINSIGVVNLENSYKAFLLNLFIEAGIIEALTQFYYSLSDVNRISSSNKELLSSCCLQLLAELCYLSNRLLYKEFNLIDLPFHLINPFASFFLPFIKINETTGKNLLNECEKEKEIVSYLANFYQNKSMININQPFSKVLVHYSIFFQQFLRNCKFFNCDKIFENDNSFVCSEQETSYLNSIYLMKIATSQLKQRKLKLKLLREVINRLETQIDLTEIQQNSDWKWTEILKLFRLYLIFDVENVENSDAMRKCILENDKLNKVLKRLVIFYTNTNSLIDVESSQSTVYTVSLTNLTQNNSNFLVDTKSKLIIICGYHLIDHLSQYSDLDNFRAIDNTDSKIPSSTNGLLFLFINNIKEYLSFGDSKSEDRINVENEAFYSSLISFIGHLSASEKGDYLLNITNLYEVLIKFIDKCENLNLLKYIITALNYKSDMARVILIKCLSCKREFKTLKYVHFKMFLLKFLRNLFHMNRDIFDLNLLEIIIDLLTDEYAIIRAYALKLFDEYLSIKSESRNQLIKFNLVPLNILKNFDLVKIICSKSYSNGWIYAQFVLNRFLLSSKFIKILNFAMYLNTIIIDWIENNLDRYYTQAIDQDSFDTYSTYLKLLSVQNGLSHGLDDPIIRLEDEVEDENYQEFENFEAQNFYRKKCQTSNYYDITTRPLLNPLHLYAALTFSNFNFQSIMDDNPGLCTHIYDHIKLICKNVVDLSMYDVNEKDVTKKLKTSLWAIACLCSSDKGLSWLLNQESSKHFKFINFIPSYIKLAEDYPNLNIRATAFYCINLICKTAYGVNEIQKYGWKVSVFSENYYSEFKETNENIVTYNLNRMKTYLNLKPIRKKEYENKKINHDLSNRKYQFAFNNLEDINNFNIVRKCLTGRNVPIESISTENSFMKCNRSVIPIVSNLMISDNILNKYLKETNFSNIIESFEIRNNFCQKSNIQVLEKSLQNPHEEVYNAIHTLIAFSTVKINDNIKIKLLALKLKHANIFNLSFYKQLSFTILFSYNIKFFLRKFIQELFINIDSSELSIEIKKSIEKTVLDN